MGKSKEKDGNQKDIEEIYQKKELREHILIRPDSYIGSVQLQDQNMWILSDDEKEIESKQIQFIPGFYKIFDEIMVNAADNFYHSKSVGIVMDTIKVKIDPVRNMISVWNNGKGIPIQMHKEHNVYVPELIFGHLLTGQNFDDDQKRVTGGKNGYGAKLANVWSTKFIVECEDSESQQYFRMEWTDNMTKKSKPIIEKRKIKSSSTCITFYPDLDRFKLEEISSDMVSLMKKRVYDIAGIYSERLKVYLNDQRINIKRFKDYVNMYLPNTSDELKIYDKAMTTDRWEILVTFSDGQFKQVSFVNSICTSKGGTHVNYITDQIVKHIQEQIAKKHKKIQIKPHLIRQNLWVFVNCLIENPAFDAQTKDTLTTKTSEFGSKPNFTEKFIKAVLGSGVIESIVEQAKVRENNALAKQLKGTKKQRITGIEKLDDANDAGTKNSPLCTLILTEGDSAKALAMAGVGIIGRDRYGVFPLKGKLLNVREASTSQIGQNKEIQNLMKIIGLQMNKKYEDTKELRYGSIMIMTDQDHDGSHIKGLIINFIHNFWPSLYELPGFLKEFVTPIIKATPKRGNQQQQSFFSVGDFKEWSKTHNLNNYTMKYYKGLGTSNEKEAIEYFKAINQHKIAFKYQNQEDDEAIQLCFNKKLADKRKNWLADYDPEAYVNHSIKTLRYLDFVNLEYIHFSNSDNIRSIPSIVDGMKPGQRKILFSCFKRNLVKEAKVAQLSGYVAEQSAYHHGEMSLASTIVGMAQSFVGSNNINYLLPNGQFGTRNLGGKDHAAPRYLYTQLSPITRKIYKEEDDHVLKYLEDENLIVEPEWYMPIIPMVLVNGAQGIGTGWSTDVPCYSPRELAKQMKLKLQGQEFTDLTPHYKGFQGDIELSSQTNKSKNTKIFDITGVYDTIAEDELEITEIPVGKWTKDYKQFLEKMLEENKIVDFKEYHTQNRVKFWIQMPENKLERMEESGQVENVFKLTTTIQTSNMVLFDPQLKIKRYEDTINIMNEFYNLRIRFYDKRKTYLMTKLQRELDIVSNKVRFILAVINDELTLKNVKKKVLCENLLKQGFTPKRKLTQVESTKLKSFKEENKEEGEEEEEEDEASGQMSISPSQFDYLLSMPLWSLTYEKVEELQQQQKKKEQEIKVLKQKTTSSMWIEDLDEFLQELDTFEAEEERVRQLGLEDGVGGDNKKRRKKKVAKKQNPDEEKENVNTENQKEKGKGQKVENDKKGVKAGKEAKKGEGKPKKSKKDKMEEEKSDDEFQPKEKKDKKPKQQKSDSPPPQKEKPIHEMTLMERAQKRKENLGDASQSEFYEKAKNEFKSQQAPKVKSVFNHAEKAVLSKDLHGNESDSDGQENIDNLENYVMPKTRNKSRKILKIVSSDEEEDYHGDENESDYSF